MRTLNRRDTIMLLSLSSLLVSTGLYAVEIDKKSLSARAPVTSADTVAMARRQGAVSINGISWQCGGARCTASASPVVGIAPVTLCQGLAREVGSMRSFTVANRVLSDAELRQCNGAAQVATAPTSHVPPGFASAPKMPTPVAPPLPGATPPKQDKPKTGFAALPTPANPPGQAIPKMPAPTVSTPSGATTPKSDKPATGFVASPPANLGNAPGLKNTNAVIAPVSISRAITTAGLAFNGLRFIPKSIATPALALTGQRFLPKTITTSGLALNGLRERRLSLAKTGFEPLIINTGSLALHGWRFHPVNIGTSSITLTGNR
jgi:hypothetical protein